jgi:hypothetical protein
MDDRGAIALATRTDTTKHEVPISGPMHPKPHDVVAGTDQLKSVTGTTPKSPPDPPQSYLTETGAAAQGRG